MGSNAFLDGGLSYFGLVLDVFFELIDALRVGDAAPGEGILVLGGDGLEVLLEIAHIN
jgi:hypothetical protein